MKLKLNNLEKIQKQKLPKDIINHIYSFDPTYHNLYKNCIDEMKEKWRKEYIDYVLWRSHCC